MVGKGVIPRTPIAVDYFSDKALTTINRLRHSKALDWDPLFFLTHAHTDHIQGLSSSWDKGTLYCSWVTRVLIIERYPGLSPDLVRGLDVGVAHIIPLNARGSDTISVTLFDANHCPGAVLLLFQGYFGTILHTGDFRFHKDVHAASLFPPIDYLYMDNTFCHPNYDSFLGRDAAVQEVVRLFETFPE